MRYFCAFILFLTISAPGTFCQERSDTALLNGVVYMGIKNINFIKNNEYSSPIIEGYTLIGYFIQPSLIYLPSDKIKIRLGTHVLNYSGAEKANQFSLVFSTTYYFTKNSFLTLGTLDGSDRHLMLDPVFDRERLYTAYKEDGFQFVTHNKYIFNDTWLSWEKFITSGDTTMEVFTSGESFRYKFPKIADAVTVEVPVQLMLKHYGGQLSNYPQHVESFFNMATGVRFNIDIDGERLGTAGIEFIQLKNNQLKKNGGTIINNGYASWLRFHYNYKALYFGSYYWKSHNFFAANGNPVYSSASTVKQDFVIPERKVFTNSLYLTFHPANSFEMYIGVDTYYDITREHMDFALAFHMNFEKMIKILALKHH
jgi:hypothetical protein